MVQGHYDTTFIGPFDSAEAAELYAKTEGSTKPQFEFCPYSESDMNDNLEEFGAVPIYTVAEAHGHDDDEREYLNEKSPQETATKPESNS